LSVIPNYNLKPVESLEIKTFGIPLVISNALHTIDIFTRYMGYWKNAVVRNAQPMDVLLVRTEPNGEQTTVDASTDLPFVGWGSYFEVVSGAATPLGRVDFTVALQRDAILTA